MEDYRPAIPHQRRMRILVPSYVTGLVLAVILVVGQRAGWTSFTAAQLGILLGVFSVMAVSGVYTLLTWEMVTAYRFNGNGADLRISYRGRSREVQCSWEAVRAREFRRYLEGGAIVTIDVAWESSSRKGRAKAQGKDTSAYIPIPGDAWKSLRPLFVQANKIPSEVDRRSAQDTNPPSLRSA